MTKLPTSIAVAAAVAFVCGSAVAGEMRCNGKTSKGGVDFSLPCMPLSPIAEADAQVFFDKNSHALTPAAMAVLDRQAEELTRFPNVQIEAVGYADTEEAAANHEKAALGQMRALAVRDYLIGRGITVDRVTASGRDYTAIIPHNKTEQALASMRYVRTETRDR